jgi:probable rRNA maturation factor
MTDYRIETCNQQAAVPINVASLEQAAAATLQAEGISTAQISLAVVDSATMRSLNKQHLQHDYDTDVLSFLLDEADKPGGRAIDGEVIVSPTIALKQATRFDWSVNDELCLYVVHGTLHLCGYDDATDQLRAAMRDREIAILATMGLVPEYSDS